MGQAVEVVPDTIQLGKDVEMEFDNGPLINIEGKLIILQPNGDIYASTATPLWSNFMLVFPSPPLVEISGFGEYTTNFPGVYDVTLLAIVDDGVETFQQQFTIPFLVLPESYLGPIALLGSSLAMFWVYIWSKKSNTRI